MNARANRPPVSACPQPTPNYIQIPTTQLRTRRRDDRHGQVPHIAPQPAERRHAGLALDAALLGVDGDGRTPVLQVAAEHLLV
jgi:hypothetical protein